MSIHIFGYGSLIATPELPQHVLSKKRADAPGYARTFNKRSPARGCPRNDAFDAFGDLLPGFQTTDWISSLALGTRIAAEEHLSGVLLSYADTVADEVLRATDHREGFDPCQNAATLGYLRRRIPLSTPLEGPVWTYLSNPSGPYHLPESTPLLTRVKLLINATPRPDSTTGREGRARGLLYVEQVRTVLWDYRVIDPYLESLVVFAQQLEGEWNALIHPPRSTRRP